MHLRKMKKTLGGMPHNPAVLAQCARDSRMRSWELAFPDFSNVGKYEMVAILS